MRRLRNHCAYMRIRVRMYDQAVLQIHATKAAYDLAFDPLSFSFGREQVSPACLHASDQGSEQVNPNLIAERLQPSLPNIAWSPIAAICECWKTHQVGCAVDLALRLSHQSAPAYFL